MNCIRCDEIFDVDETTGICRNCKEDILDHLWKWISTLLAAKDVKTFDDITIVMGIKEGANGQETTPKKR